MTDNFDPTRAATTQSLYGHFKRSEFLCKCGKSKCTAESFIVNPELIAWLNDIRAFTARPVIVNSGYRCHAHNQQVGGSLTSSHLTGHAVDIQCSTSRYRAKLIEAIYATRGPITRVGIAENFIHIDNDTAKLNGMLWLY